MSGDGYVMEKIADRVRVEIATLGLWGRSKPFIWSEFRSKWKSSEIWRRKGAWMKGMQYMNDHEPVSHNRIWTNNLFSNKHLKGYEYLVIPFSFLWHHTEPVIQILARFQSQIWKDNRSESDQTAVGLTLQGDCVIRRCVKSQSMNTVRAWH